MSGAKKALEKILSGKSDKNVSNNEAISALERSGFSLDGGKGSHRLYRHPDGRKMVIPAHGKDLKPVYVKQIRELLK